VATQEESDKLLQELTEEHSDLEPIETGADDKDNGAGGDNGDDNSDDATAGDQDDPDQKDASGSDDEDDAEAESGDQADGADSDKSDDSEDAGAKPVGPKKNRDTRIEQLLREKKELEEKYAEKIAEETKQKELTEDPIYEVDDFIGTVGEDGEVLTDAEAKARFQAWDADYKLRQYQRTQVMREQAETLISLQRETKDAFDKFPEFNESSDKYDEELADIANEAFSAGLIYSPGHDGDNDYIIGSRINPGQLLEKIHKKYFKEEAPVTKVNNLGDDGGQPVVSSRQVSKKAERYAPGFQGEVDQELDKLIKAKKG